MQEKREFAGWWLWSLLLVVITIVVLSLTGYGGRFVDVFVERQVFESSYQYQEGKDVQISTYRAQIAELEGKLSNPDLDDSARANINAQLSSLRIQLNAAIEQQRGK